MEQLRAELTGQIRAQNVLSAGQLAPLLALPSLDDVHAMGLVKALAVIIGLDARRAYLVWRLRHNSGTPEIGKVIGVVRRQAALAKNALFLSKMQNLFHLWHVVHRPFSYSLALLATLHVIVVLYLGYF